MILEVVSKLLNDGETRQKVVTNSLGANLGSFAARSASNRTLRVQKRSV